MGEVAEGKRLDWDPRVEGSILDNLLDRLEHQARSWRGSWNRSCFGVIGAIGKQSGRRIDRRSWRGEVSGDWRRARSRIGSRVGSPISLSFGEGLQDLGGGDWLLIEAVHPSLEGVLNVARLGVG